MDSSQKETSKTDEIRPDIREFFKVFQGPIDIRSIALSGILILGVFYTLYFARDFFLPVILAVLLNLLLTPVVQTLGRFHVPEAVGAAVVILIVLGIVTYGIVRLSTPAYQWIEKSPRNLLSVQLKLRNLLRPIEEVKKTTQKLENLAALEKGEKTAAVKIKEPALSDVMIGETPRIVFWASVMTILLYFLLASGDLFLLKLVRVLPTLEDKKRAVEISRRIERDISTYLSTVTLVNIGLGTAVGLAMYFVGMPNAVLWGVMAALLNYIPYLGAFVGISVVAFAAILTFDKLVPILLVPTLYFVLNFCEAYLVTPMILGRRLALNPVIIFLWLIFWGWIWGIIGAVLAVPLLAIFKIICDHFKPLAAVGEFIGTEPTDHS